MLQNTQWTQFAESWMDWAGLFNEPRNYNRLAAALGQYDQMAQPWEAYIEFARRYTEHYHELHDDRLLAHKSALEICGFTITFDGGQWIAETAGLECRQPTLADTLNSVEMWAIPQQAAWDWTACYGQRKNNERAGGLD